MPRLSVMRDPEEAGSKPRRRPIALLLDGKAWLRVEEEAFGELGVADGDSIDAARRAEVETVLARARARLFVVRSLAARAQSAAELEQKLAARDVPPEIAHEAIERAAGYGYVDDPALAGQLARGMKARGYGRRRAAHKLRTRGLARVAEAALAEAYGSDDEVELARAALGRRPVGADADRRRAVAFLGRRGFSASSAWKAVRDAAAESAPAGG